MLSSRRICTLARDAMRDFVAITYNARGALITYQASFVGLDKNLSNPIGLLNFLARVDKKDAVSKIIIIYDIYRSFLEFYLPIQFCIQL